MLRAIHVRLTSWLQRLDARNARTRALYLAAALGIVVGVETVGRWARTEWLDLAAVIALVVAFVLVLRAHRIRRIQTLRGSRRLAQRLVRWLRGQRLEIGIDLRQSPRLPSGVPGLHRGIATALALLLAFCTLFRMAELPFRTVAQYTLYTPLALGLTAIWLACLGVVVLSVVVIAFCAHDFVQAHYPDLGRRVWRWTAWSTLGMSALAVICAAALPNWIPIVFAATSSFVLIVALLLRRLPDFHIVWRDDNRAVRSMQFRDYVPLEVGVLTLAWSIPLVLTLGCDGVVSGALGNMAAWFGGIALTGATFGAHLWLYLCQRRNPARPSPMTVRVDGAIANRDQLERAMETYGARIRDLDSTSEPLDVAVELRARPPRADERQWPWPVTERELRTPEFLEFLQRRDAAQCRNLIVDVIERQLATARARKFKRGNGYWVAPHLWCFPGLMRDESEREIDEQEWMFFDSMIGRPWHTMLDRHALHHLHQTLEDLDVDLIFVEDAVEPDVMRAVFDRLFERHDWAPNQRLEEQDLQAVLGARLMLHEVHSDPPPRQQGYPEPGYDDIGRARVLHVFKDRGGEDAEIDVPDDGIRLPKLGPVLSGI